MTTLDLNSFTLTIDRDFFGEIAAYVEDSQEASAFGEEAIIASFLQEARDAGAEDALYAAVAAEAIHVGDKVKVPEVGMNANVTKIHADGDLQLRFSDGDEGSYSVAEVEKL